MGPFAPNQKINRDSEAEIERRVQDAMAHWIAALADQVKNPVAGISAALGIVRREVEAWPRPQGSANQEAVLHTLEQAHTRLYQLDRYVTELINFTHPAIPDCTPLRASELVDEAFQDAMKLVPLSYTYGIDDSVGPQLFQGDRAMLKAAFTAIIVNGLQAVPTEREPELSLGINRSANGRWLEFRFCDNGVGFSQADLDRPQVLFEPFKTTKDAGTGLGLALARKMVLSHGGKILLNNAGDGPGAEVTVYLPTKTQPNSKGILDHP